MFSSAGMGQVSVMTTPGYHFLPNDEELVSFLQKKVRGDGDGPTVVEEIDIYGGRNPWELFNKDVKKDYYVFAKLKKKGRGVRRIDRTAGSGTWKERQTKDHDKNNVHWVRKDFLFVPEKKKTEEPSNGNGCGHGHWIMHEYSLNADGNEANDYVICKIKNKYASQEDYGPGGLEGIERFLAQVRLLNQQFVKNQDGVVRDCNKRKLHVDEEDRQQELQKKNRTSNNYSHQQSSSNSYNLGCSNDCSSTFLSLPVGHDATWVNSRAIVRTESCSSCDKYVAKLISEEEFLPRLETETVRNGNAIFFSASTTDQLATPINSANIFPYQTAVFAEEDQFCVSYHELFDDTPEFYFPDS